MCAQEVHTYVRMIKYQKQCYCHTRFSKEQNQDNHMCAQEVHTYVRMKKYQNNVYIKRKTYYINTYNYQSVAEKSLIFSSGSNITGTADWGFHMPNTSEKNFWKLH
jgi:hypothetical protein